MKFAVRFVLLLCAFVATIAETSGARPVRYNLKKLIRTGRGDPSAEYLLEAEKRLNPKTMRTGRSVPADSGKLTDIERVEPLLEEDFSFPYPAYYDFPLYRF